MIARSLSSLLAFVAFPLALSALACVGTEDTQNPQNDDKTEDALTSQACDAYEANDVNATLGTTYKRCFVTTYQNGYSVEDSDSVTFNNDTAGARYRITVSNLGPSLDSGLEISGFPSNTSTYQGHIAANVQTTYVTNPLAKASWKLTLSPTYLGSETICANTQCVYSIRIDRLAAQSTALSAVVLPQRIATGKGGTKVTGTIKLAAAASDDTVVSLADADAGRVLKPLIYGLPSSVTIKAGAISAPFTFSVKPVQIGSSLTVNATLNDMVKSATALVAPN